MGRPRTPIGHYGDIHVTKMGKVHEAEAWFRMANGQLRRVRKRGTSPTAARNALKTKLTSLADEVAGKAISSSTRFTYVIDLWLADLERKVELGTRAPKTSYDYRDTVNNHIRKQLGELCCSEVSVTACDDRIKAVHDEIGFASAKRLKVVLAGICGYGVRHGAVFAGGQGINPVKLVEAVEQGGQRKEIRVLESEQRADFLAKLRVDVKKRTAADYDLGPRARAWTDLPDITEGMLSTGVRLGEVLAVVGDDIDPVAQTVHIGSHLVRVKGRGIVRMSGRKGGEPALTLKLPSWSLPMWRRRKLAAGPGPVFPSWNDKLVDPSNVGKRFRKACDAIGYGEVSSHVFRHTVGTHLGDDDMVSTAIGDQLGNSAPVVEKNYRRKRVANSATAASLESMFGSVADEA